MSILLSQIVQSDTTANRSDRTGKVPVIERFLSREQCRLIRDTLESFKTGKVPLKLAITSEWRGDLRWARNRATSASEYRDSRIQAGQERGGGRIESANVFTNQTDIESLRSVVESLERQLSFSLGMDGPSPIHTSLPEAEYPKTAIWSDATYGQSSVDRNDIVNKLIESSEREGMLSAGYISVSAHGEMISEAGQDLYSPYTLAQCSLTVRNREGTASGWAGASSYDWNRFDAQSLGEIALDKCLRSKNPVAIEPGRYTVVLEPQAAYEIVNPLFVRISRPQAEDMPAYPLFSHYETVETHPVLGPVRVGVSKLGEKLIDERISLSFDPLDPDLGVIPYRGFGEPVRKANWYENGVLTKLAYPRSYAQGHFRENLGFPLVSAYRMSGGTTSIEEMIATTKRGLLVTRFSAIDMIDLRSLLHTGVTRDGLWLIENGKISKSVKNLRFTESPFFVLNQVEQLGVPVPVFSPGSPCIVPPIKTRDFSFTSLIDAV